MGKWSNTELDTLKVIYKSYNKELLLKSFPNKTLKAIQDKAYSLGITNEKRKHENIEFNCIICGKKVSKYNNLRNSNKFCSKKCYYKCKNPLGNVLITCKICGKQKEVKRNEYNRGQHKYCSQECCVKDRLLQTRGITTREKICELCGSKYLAKNKDTKFCSTNCSSKYHSIWVKQNQNGINNPFYGKKHTNETREHLSTVKKELFRNGTLVAPYKNKKLTDNPTPKRDHLWKLIRDSVLELDSNSCVLCKSTYKLEVHHIIPYRKQRNHSIDNLITLCKKCHNKLYKKEHTMENILKDIIIKRSNTNK